MSDKRLELNTQIETMKNLREEAGFNRREFSDYMGIPLRTLEEWEAGRRKMPDYVLRLIAYYVRMQKYIMDNGISDEMIEGWGNLDSNDNYWEDKRNE
ncbi:MAG: helix-turn-helix domain-containing protein [Lachnospiraceae bacterium]|nr:helix-turn-helix domain-containing protein [Lachnospiraceae bacterium]